MKLITILITLLLSYSKGYAQEPAPDRVKPSSLKQISISCSQTLTKDTLPIFILFKNEKYVIINNDSVSVIDKNWIIAVDIIKPPKSVANYGEIGKNGAILVYVKDTAYKLFPLWLKQEFARVE